MCAWVPGVNLLDRFSVCYHAERPGGVGLTPPFLNVLFCIKIMPNKSHSNASQLRIFKARDIAYDIVKTKADLLVALYCDRKQPKTHTDI